MANIASLEMSGCKLVFAIPNVYMNESGLAIQKIANFYDIDSKQIIVAHDDADLVTGNFKIAYGCSSAGHKGIESTIANLNTPNF